jgi:hypothetical protein
MINPKNSPYIKEMQKNNIKEKILERNMYVINYYSYLSVIRYWNIRRGTKLQTTRRERTRKTRYLEGQARYLKGQVRDMGLNIVDLFLYI